MISQNPKAVVEFLNKRMSELRKISPTYFNEAFFRSQLSKVEGLNLGNVLTKKNRFKVSAIITEEEFADITALIKPWENYAEEARKTLLQEEKAPKLSKTSMIQELGAKRRIDSVLDTANDMYYKLVQDVAAILGVTQDEAEGIMSKADETKGLVREFSKFGSQYAGRDISYRQGVRQLHKIIEQLPIASNALIARLRG